VVEAMKDCINVRNMRGELWSNVEGTWRMSLEEQEDTLIGLLLPQLVLGYSSNSVKAVYERNPW